MTSTPQDPQDIRFHDLTSTDELKFVNHNPTDYDGFNKFQEQLEARFSKVQEEKTKKELTANLAKWEDLLPDRWRGAALPLIKNDAAAEVMAILKGADEVCNFYFRGESGAGKTYLAYATLRRYIGKGWTTPSHIKMVSEELLLSYAGTGWEGNKSFAELFASVNTIYLIDGVFRKESYTDKEIQFYERVVDHIYTKSLNVIFTSNKPASQFANLLSDSGRSKFIHLVKDRTITVAKNGQVDEPKLDDSTDADRAQLARDEQVEGLWD